MPPAVPFWATPRGVATLVALYLLVHLGIRLAMAPSLGLDDAEQALFAQHWLPSYRTRAPPLFTWLLLGLSPLFGVGIVAISFLRYVLLAVTAAFFYATARRLIADPRLSALSVYSFATIYLFAYYSHHDLTHTTTLAAVLAACWYVVVRLVERPTTPRYAALGVLFALGVLSKWNFAIFILALAVAALLLQRYRRFVLTPKARVTLALAVIPVLPVALATLQFGQAEATLGAVLGTPQTSYLAGVVNGIVRLISALLEYPQPFLFLFAACFAPALWRGFMARRPAPSDGPAPAVDAVFLATVMALAISVYLALVLAGQATQFKGRLMQPPLMMLPILLFMVVERGKPSVRSVQAFALIAAGLAVLVAPIRVGLYRAGDAYCGTCRALVPYEQIASILRANGFQGRGTIIADDFNTGGNLRVLFPGTRVAIPGSALSVWPEPRGQGQCLLAWPARSTGALTGLTDLLIQMGGDPQAPHRDGTASAPMIQSDSRSFELAYRLYEGPTGDCR